MSRPNCKECQFIASANKKMGWTIWPCIVHRKEDEEKKNAAEIAMFERIFVGTGNEYQEERDRRLVEQESERNFDSVYPDWGSNPVWE